MLTTTNCSITVSYLNRHLLFDSANATFCPTHTVCARLNPQGCRVLTLQFRSEKQEGSGALRQHDSSRAFAVAASTARRGRRSKNPAAADASVAAAQTQRPGFSRSKARFVQRPPSLRCRISANQCCNVHGCTIELVLFPTLITSLCHDVRRLCMARGRTVTPLFNKPAAHMVTRFGLPQETMRYAVHPVIIGSVGRRAVFVCLFLFLVYTMRFSRFGAPSLK